MTLIGRPKLRLGVNAFLAFAVCASAFSQDRPDKSDGLLEPSYKGQPLSHWIEILNGGWLSSRWWPEINEIEGGAGAREAIEHIGPFAVPFLLKRIPERGSMIAFRILGPAAKSAIPELVAMATNELAAASKVQRPPSGLFAIGMNPLTVLGWIGPDSLPALTMILSNYNEPDIRYTTIQALGIMGTNGAPAVPALLPCLNDKNEMVAHEAVRVLGLIHNRQQAAFEALTNVLQTRPAVRSEAVVALAGFGDEALPILFEGLEGKNSVAYFMVTTPWLQKSPEVLTNATLLKILAAGLRSSNIETRDWSAEMLRAAGQRAQGIRPQHPAEQEEGMNQIRVQATNALRSLAPQLLSNSSP
jgi:hypothetical protein